MKKSNKITCPICGNEITTEDNCKSINLKINVEDGNLKDYLAEVNGLLKEITKGIEASGYLDVNIVRRWLPSQCLAMLNSKDGFHATLKNCGYDYYWKVLVDELARQDKLSKTDPHGYFDRNRWYNKETAVKMANFYIVQLKDFVSGLTVKKHKKRKYVDLIVKGRNNCKGMHLDELVDFYVELEELVSNVQKSNTPHSLVEAVRKFDAMRKSIRFTPDSNRTCDAFFNTYKAAGAYYTMKDLIMFEGCKIKASNNGSTKKSLYDRTMKFTDTESSLMLLEEEAYKVVEKGVCEFGYELLGLLKDFCEHNGFNYTEAKKGWSDKSKMRKALRLLKRCERRC